MQDAQGGRASTVTTHLWRDPDQHLIINRAGPLTVIGQGINPAGRPRLAAALRRGDMGPLQYDARRQVAAGAVLLDLNVYLPPGAGAESGEVVLLPAAVAAISTAVAVPLVLDSADPHALLAALAVCPGRAVVNSLTGVPRVLDELLPAVAAHGAVAIALPLDKDGIPPDVAGRLRIAAYILDRAAAAGIAPHDIIVDGLALPATREGGCAITLATLRALAEEFGVNTVVGAGNVSFGSPSAHRDTLSATFLAMAMGAGLSCVIADPLSRRIMEVVAAGNRLLGRRGRETVGSQG